ncbi:MAG TPA: DUF2339 domain-containing protein [Bryobacteraceae bacterium]|nr:DUF2339 domain-containing protein [Bryobacteraceae bacterium]
MTEFFLVILIVVLLIRWAVLSSRLREIKDRVEELSRSRQGSQNDELIVGLIQRVHALETATRQAPPVPAADPVQEITKAPVPEVAPVPVVKSVELPPPVIVPPIEPVLTRGRTCPVCYRLVGHDAAMCFCGYMFESVAATPPPLPEAAGLTPETEHPPELPVKEPEVVAAPVFASSGGPSAPAEELGVRSKMGGQEWEALVGGNWLNKLGVLVLVIGIALLLSYSFTQTGPAGRVGIGLLVSLAMLGVGVAFERREAYRVFGRGLIGGGWAALYFTAYAMHDIAAAKVIDNPYTASALLFGVAAGMILHSLRYRSQTVTGLAYFIAFAALMLSHVTPFAVIALIPLAGSLLVIAYRFSWFAMAVFGLFATWGTLISRGDSGAPLETTQAVFTAYWLLFEIFDLMRTARRDRDTILTQLILPLNALAFLVLSWHKWDSAAPGEVWKFFAAAGATYVMGAVLRVKVRPPSSFAFETGTVERISLGGYEGPITIAALLAGISICLKAPTVWINAAC